MVRYTVLHAVMKTVEIANGDTKSLLRILYPLRQLTIFVFYLCTAAFEIRSAEQEARSGEESTGGAEAPAGDGDVSFPTAQGQRHGNTHTGQEEKVDAVVQRMRAAAHPRSSSSSCCLSACS